MNTSKKSKLILTLIGILLILNITTIKNTPDYYGSPIKQIPNSSAFNGFSEDFTTTTFMDSSNTNTSGWGSGKLSLPEKNVTICHFDDGDPYGCVKVHVSGDIAFAADKRGMEVYNISNPSSPELINYYDTAFYDVYFTSNYAYVASYSFGFQILSISDPTNIYIVGSNNVYFTDPLRSDRRYADKIIVSGSYAYIWDLYHVLVVFSITNPANPVMVGDWSESSAYLVYDMLIRGNHLYLVANSIAIFDISTPIAPIFRSFYSSGTPSDTGLIHDNLMYLGGSYTLDIVNLNNPESPSLVNSISTSFTYPRTIYIHNNDLYLGGGRLIGSAHYDGGVEAYNIDNPVNPIFEFKYMSPCSIYIGSSLIYSIMISGDYAYMLDFYNEFIIANFNYFNQFEILGVAQSLTAFSGSDSFLLTQANFSATFLTPLGTLITYYLSADNGTHWEQVSLGTEHFFNNLGNKLKWKAEFSTIDPLVTPELSQISISYKYILKAPNLITPDNETLSVDNTPYFEWEDLSGASNYRIQLDTSSSFNSLNLRILDIVTNYWLPSVALDDGIWYWKVAGRDSEGDLGFYSNYRILTIDAPPQSPTLMTPSDNSHINTLNPSFSWSSVSDAENYTIDIDTSTSFTSMNLISISGIESENYYLATVLFDDMWYWRVHAYDAIGNQGAYSITHFFVVDTITPIIDEPDDISYTEGDTGNELTWIVSDLNPNSCIINRNGIIIQESSWNGNSITLNVDGLSSGTHTYNCTVFDKAGNSDSDLVVVTINTVNPEIISIGYYYLIFMLIGISSVLVRMRVSKVRNENNKKSKSK